MALPFRRQASPDSDSWTPPDYASPSDNEDKWKPPDYATAVDEKPKDKPNRIKEALTPAKTIHPGSENDPIQKVINAGKSIWGKISEPLTEAPSRFAENVSEYINPERTTKGARGIGSAYIESLGNTISGLSSPLNLALAATGAGEAVKIPGAAFATKALSAPIVAEGLKNVYSGKGLSEKALGAIEAGTGALGLHGLPEAEETSQIKQPIKQAVKDVASQASPVKTSEELPIKQNVQRMSPEFTPVGSEEDFNTPRIAAEQAEKQKIKDSSKSAFRDKSTFINPFEKETPITLESESKPRVDIPLKVEEVQPVAEETASSEAWKPPEYAQPVQKGELPTSEAKLQDIIDTTDATKTPESLHPQLTGLKNYGDGVLYLDFDKSKPLAPEDVKALFPGKDIDVTEMHSSNDMPSRFRVDVKGDDEVHSDQLGNEIEQSVGGAFDKSNPRESLTGETGALKLGGSNPSVRNLEPNKGPYGAALDKLFNAMDNIQESRVKQDILNRTERVKRFAAFSDVEDVGVKGAAQQLSKLKGEYEKVDFDRLRMTPPQVDSLFTAVKRANITSGEKARGYTALFKLMNGSEVPVRSELKILDDVFGNNFADKITMMHGGIGAVGLKVSKLANTAKSMENAISLAAPLRHGIGLVTRKEFGPAFRDMFKFFADKDFYKASMNAIEQKPNYLLGRESGLFIAKPDSLMNSEEEFLNSYVGNIPIVRNVVGASQRAYTGFLNKLRSDTFDGMLKQAEGLGVKTSINVGGEAVPTKEAKAIAKFINNATGRGDLGSLNKMTNELNTLFWSPRMIASRVNMLANPKMYMDLPKGMRLEGLKSLLGIAVLGTTIDTLASYGGAKVSTNILSTDFGKSRFGKTLIDPWGGFQQYIVGAARFLAGKTDNDKAYPPTNRLDIAGRFLSNKLSPAASLARNILTAKKFTGQGDFTTQYGEKTSIQKETAKAFTPIFIQDLQDLVKTNPDWADNIGLTTALAGASMAGMEQNYPESKKGAFRNLKP